jgi:glycosyltransferase involved in cell wall biosynthesis
MSRTSRLRLEERDLDGVRVVETPDLLPGAMRSGWDLWDTLRRLLWLRGRRFDIVHAFEARPVVIFPALFAKQGGAKLVMDWCDWFGRGGSVEERPPLMRFFLRPIETFFEERFRGCADGTLTINSFLRDRAVALGVDPKSITVLYNGTDTGVPVWEVSEARQAVGLPAGVPLIGYVGGIYPRDVELMAAAFNRVQHILPGARLVLVGYFNREIEPLLDHPEAVIRTGWVTKDKVFQYLAGCDLCWLPMYNSGTNRGRWPGKLNDYMAVGRPTVATAVGDQAVLIPQHRIGLVTGDDPDDFAAHTVEVLSDRNRCEEMGRTARRTGAEVLNWEAATDRLVEFYGRVLKA